MLAKELLNFLNIFRKRSRGEGEEKSQECNPTYYFPPPIKRRDVIDGRWVPKTEQDDKDEKEKPSWIVEYSDKRHDNNSD